MGCRDSTPDGGLNREVERDIAKTKAKRVDIKKLILLGAGGSGKSTFFKQLQRIHGAGFSPQERKNFKYKIKEQILTQMRLLVMKCRQFGGGDIDRKGNNIVPEIHMDDPDYSELRISTENSEAANFMLKISVSVELAPEVVKCVKQLWSDVGIQCGWQLRAKLCIVDSSKYFFDNIDRIAEPNFLPNDQDLLLNRYMTTGMSEKKFIIKGSTLNIVDVGGQRSERRKWIHFFDDVTAILFVASLSCYDEILFEDNSMNVMDETLSVFDTAWNMECFENTAFILFLNKSDVFQEKLQYSSIKQAFPDYSGTNDYNQSLTYIQEVFESRSKNNNRSIYSHVTCATDEKNVEKVFNDVQHIIVNSSLESSGIL